MLTINCCTKVQRTTIVNVKTGDSFVVNHITANNEWFMYLDNTYSWTDKSDYHQLILSC